MHESPVFTPRSAISILFADSEGAELERESPSFFSDLNLDQVVQSITEGRKEFGLEEFFYTRLESADAIAYRHEVLRDLQEEGPSSCIASFGTRMRGMRKHLAQVEDLYYEYQKKAWFLDAAGIYCDAVQALSRDLAGLKLGSRGLRRFRDYLAEYTGSARFTELVTETKDVKDRLVGLRYRVHIKGRRITVSRYESEPDYSAEVERTFEKFKRGAVSSYRARFPGSVDMNSIEGKILNLVAKLHPQAFGPLDVYCERHRDYLDQTVAGFDREVQFYVAYLEYVERLSKAGLRFSYPLVTDDDKEIHARETFDIALANKLVPEESTVVPNDFELTGPERIIVVTGPNQGGKTTFARMFGQLHHLASIGLLVPGSSARLYMFDQLFTHFEREEDITSLSGKLEDDLVRIHRILERATGDSIVIMNESFTSTTLSDALVLGKAVMQQLIERDLLGVHVTFVDELASLSDATVSMVSQVVPDDPATRTYKVVRKPADGLAYAAAIAAKYGLTYERAKERLAV